MAYYSQPNNSNDDKKKKIMTNDVTLKNANCKFPIALEIKYSDDMLSLIFTPPLPEQERIQGQRLFDYNNQIWSGMSRPKAMELYDLYNEVIKPAIDNNEAKFAGIKLFSGKNVIGFDTGLNLFKDGTIHPCLVLIRNLDDDNKSTDVLVYEFNRSESVIDYNPTTGESKNLTTHAELNMFINDLRSYCEAGSKAYIHAARQVDEYYKNVVLDYLKALSSKVGVAARSGSGQSASHIPSPYDSDEGFMNIPDFVDINEDDALPFD